MLNEVFGKIHFLVVVDMSSHFFLVVPEAALRARKPIRIPSPGASAQLCISNTVTSAPAWNTCLLPQLC